MSFFNRIRRTCSFCGDGWKNTDGRAEGGDFKTTIDQTLMRGLDTASPCIRLGPASVSSRASICDGPLSVAARSALQPRVHVSTSCLGSMCSSPDAADFLHGPVDERRKKSVAPQEASDAEWSR
jgi:hypothetical protein